MPRGTLLTASISAIPLCSPPPAMMFYSHVTQRPAFSGRTTQELAARKRGGVLLPPQNNAKASIKELSIYPKPFSKVCAGLYLINNLMKMQTKIKGCKMYVRFSNTTRIIIVFINKYQYIGDTGPFLLGIGSIPNFVASHTTTDNSTAKKWLQGLQIFGC